MTASSTNNSVFRGFFEKQRLTGPNFIDWYRQLRIVLSIEDKLNYLEQPIPPAPVAPEGQLVASEIIAAHTAWIKGSKEIELKTLFAQQSEQELLQTVREFHSCKQEEGQSISSYVLKMKGYIDNLEHLGHPVSLNLGLSLILISLRKEFDSFVRNYNMHNMGKTINELHAMLKLHEQTLPKNNAHALHPIRAGYWKRNCPQYLAELLKNKKLSQGASDSGIFTIVLYTFPNKSWVYDTGCGTHICSTTQGLSGSRKLKPVALSLYVGIGQHAEVEAIISYHLSLPSGLVIVLNNCHYAPAITRWIISVSRLYNDGYVNCFVDNLIQVSRNNMVYFSDVPRDGIFEINLSDSYTNVSSIYALSNKRSKSNLGSTLLWHCHLGQTSKKRIEKLQHNGLLNSADLRAFEKCVPCMFEKMERKPYTHQVERAKDLLGLIHTDVCGPFKIMSRQGESYFVTFTDDFSRYGYVYLLKHKHEVFETFKVFQKEVENQLGKTIKSLHSDRGGEYMSQEFLDHPRDHGIIAHRTPPYTPQHNKTAARILNMVPTKKVEKTPYKVWHGQAPKLSYLKVWGCEALVKRDTLTKPDKLKPRSIKCIFVGYPKETIDLEIIQEEDTHPSIDTSLHHEEDDLEIDKPQSDIIPIRRSTRTRHAPDPAFYDYAIWQMNVKNAFLNRHLSEEVYMEQPEGFVNPKYPNRKFGFTQNRDEPCVYLKANGSNVTFLILYVDDILIMGNNIPMLQDVKSYLGRCFAMKDLGEAAYILGIKIYRDRSRRLIGLCRSAYIEKILKRYHMENSKRGSIPMQEKLRLSKSQGASTPADLKRMNTKDMFLNGYVFILNGGIVDWKSAKQSIFATSSAEAEYIAAYDAFKEAVWVRKFISGLGVVSTIKEPINMYCDNTRAITIANESGITKGARHFCAKVHYLREVIEYGDVKLEKVHTDDNLADLFTKALAFLKHSEHTKNIGMFPASSFMQVCND
ncbi:putative retrotransposon protein [Tanacetum coccineum]